MTHTRKIDDLPGWARKIVIGGSIGYAGASVVASSIALGHLAHTAGYDLPRSVLFGLGFDVAALVTGTAWASTPKRSWWHATGRNATVGLFAASLVFQAAEVLQVRGNLPPQGLLVVAVFVSFVFPALALVFGHLGLVAKGAQDGPALELAARRAELDAQQAAVLQREQLLLASVAGALATVDGAREAGAAQLQLEREQLERERAELEARAAALVPPAEVPAPPAGGDVDPEADLVRRVAQFITEARAANPPVAHGQRPVAEKFGVPRPRAGELIRAAERYLAQRPTNGHKVLTGPLPQPE